jgi:recombination protein RecA
MTSAALIKSFDAEFPEEDAGLDLHYMDTGFAPLNYAMSGKYDGGWAYGRMYEIFGESGTGKTALLTEAMARAQEMGGCAGLIDWERTFNIELAKDGYKMKDDRPFWYYHRPATWETGNTRAAKYCQWVRDNKIIAPEAPIVVGFDSIASAIPKSSAEKEFDEHTMNDTTALARATSTTLKSMAMYAERYNAIFVYLNQMRLKPGVVYGDPRTTPGGKAMEFFATGRLALGKEKVMQQVDGAKEFVGQKINIQVVKTKLTKPYKEASMRMSFDEAGTAYFDKDFSLVEAVIEAKKIPLPRNGFVEWEGKQLSKRAFSDLVKAASLQPKLVEMLSAS